ncbi:hypothetical protein GLOTRDRAFT_98089 [Gloeophyllum trabeum ATCC 11539]|uniref:Uncharacterized protein n=1 Tax=Gloeophyllum trabeum (strain ATCC 11539 / FP-39264 / Madison 617) TaxID=670483 RepID=S7S1G1_GLOTA|nr:uncharacterized protein GLOTRDRAFT_98089 [Gloeophyllum trabeum ATCC 11539]EPQ61290.1 hypothetical protein GLOTRDRAFT_98089 [Gloeophyllum trabeum ATCC 11539]
MLFDLTHFERAKFHQTDSRGTPWASVRPQYDVVLVWLTSALEEVEEQMPSLYIDVPGVRTASPL